MSPTYVQRGADGEVIGLIQRELTADERATGQWATVAADGPEVAAFLRRVGSEHGANPLADTDAALARVTEDLIDVLIDKGVIQFTDLPAAAQTKLLQRRQTRSRLANRLNLLGDSDII